MAPLLVLFANFAKVTSRNRNVHGLTWPASISTACLIIHTHPISRQLGLVAPDSVGGEILQFPDVIMSGDAAASNHCTVAKSRVRF